MKKLILLFGVVATSFSAIFVRYSNAPAVALVFWRLLFSFGLLVPAVAVFNRRELRTTDFKAVFRYAVSGIFLGLHFITYFAALAHTSVGAAVVLANTEVFFVAICSALFWREKQSGRGLAGIGVTFAGGVLVALGAGAAGADPLRGNLLALCSGMLMAVYTLIGRTARKTQSTNVYTFYVYGFAALTVALVSLLPGGSALRCGSRDLWIALALAVVCTLLGHSIFSWGLRYEKATFISAVKQLEPVFAALLALMLLGEMPTVSLLLGGPLMIGGIWWYSRCKGQ